MKQKTRNSTLYILVSIFLAFFMAGCGESILLDADLDKATVKMYTPPPPETVSEEQMEKMQGNSQAEKYRIEGTDAFYILPPHQPAPDNILEFKLLDVLDGTTTVYAYQAVYQGDDEGGIGQEPEQGTAKTGTVGQMSEPSRMATVLMSYNTKTKEYHIFFHKAGELRSLNMDGENSELVTKNMQETETLFVQKVGSEGEYYFLYYDGAGYVYSQNGELVYTKDISGVLSLNASKYGGENGTATIQDVVMDSNYFMYVLMNIEKGDSQIDENTTEDQLDDEEESDIVQLLYSCFYLDIGEDGYYFLSENQNVQKQIEEWKTNVDGQTFLLDFETEDDSAPDMKEIYKKVADISAVRGQYPDIYPTYSLANMSFPMELYYYIPKSETWYWLVNWYWENGRYLWGLSRLNGANPVSMMPGRIRSEPRRMYAAVLPAAENRWGEETQFVFPRRIVPSEQQPVSEKLKRTYTVKWTQNTQNLDETIEITEKEMTVEEEAEFVYSYSLRFPKNTIVQWSEVRYTSDMIGSSAGTGVVRFYSNGEEGEEISLVLWEQNQSQFAGLAEGKVSNTGIVSQKGLEKPVLVMFTSKNIVLFPDFAAGRTNGSSIIWVPNRSSQAWNIPYSDINFGLSMGEDNEAQLNQMKIPDTDSDVMVTEEDSFDFFHDYSIQLDVRNGTVWMYVAGLNSGLVKYNLSAGETILGRAGQLSPYPYYGIWLNQVGNANELYAIGFQSQDYTYQQEDISKAKLYKIPLFDENACANLVSSAVVKDADLKKTVLDKNMSAWNQMIQALGIQGGDLTRVNQYRAVLIEGKKKNDEALADFYNLIALDQSLRTQQTRTKVEACRYVTELEDLIVELKKTDVQTVREEAGMTKEQWQKKLEEIVKACREAQE